MSFSDIIGLLQYPPVLRGAVVLLAAGTFFPLIGVFVIRLNLITLRFAVMHSALLGAAIALAAGLSPLPVMIGVNVLLVLGIAVLGKKVGPNLGHITTFFMVLTIGLAFAVLYRFNVPANDSLGLLWGNVFALTRFDAFVTVGFALFIMVLVLTLFPKLMAVLYDRELAFTAGVPSGLIHTGILFTVGLTITLTMGLIGALLLDAVLILPALIAGVTSRSLRGLFVQAMLFGFLISVVGFVFAIGIDIPASSGVTIVGALVLGFVSLVSHIQRRHA